MLKRTGLLGMWKPKNIHSLEHLKYLYSILHKNQTVTENNKSLLVETLRSIAEILIWGDQNDSSVFDFFLERNMLSFFLTILNQKCGSYVCVQLLQTLNILFENIRNETSIYYLLSNNHVNSIIVHKFDFSDEEVMAYYISFLKTLSFRLNKHTIHFFYNEHKNDFPLYTEAIKFFNHGESMVRIAVRTLTLNVYRVDEESMLQFVIDKTAAPYFSNLVWFIGNHILEMDACVRNDVDHQSLNRLKDLVADHLDHLHYLNDILCLGIDNLNKVLTDHLLSRLFIPLYIYSLVRKCNTNSIEVLKPHVSRVTAHFLLCHVFLILTHAPLVRLLAWTILAGNHEVFTERGAARLYKAYTFSPNSLESGTGRDTADILSSVAQRPSVDEGRIKPRFAAPSQTLEKSLQERMRVESSSSPVSNPLTGRTTKTKAGGTESGGTYGSNCSGGKSLQQGQEPEENPTSLSITDEEKELRLSGEVEIGAREEISAMEVNEGEREGGAGCHGAESSSVVESNTEPEEGFSLSSRPFLAEVFDSLNCCENDYLPLFAVCLLYAIQDNAGMDESLLESIGIPCSKSPTKDCYNNQLLDKLLQLLYSSCQNGSKIRLITLDVAVAMIQKLAISDKTSFLSDQHFAEIEGIKEEGILLLRNFYKNEEIFLDMFEDEYRASSKPMPRVELVLSDASLLLPPTATPLTGIDFARRLPCGEVERAKKAIRTFFRLRQLSLDLQGLEETYLPLLSPDSCVQVQDVLDLNNSDLLAVNVTTSSNSSVSIGHRSTASDNLSSFSEHGLFLVVDIYQIVLVEPDTKLLGWGVAIFAGFLQDLEVVSDKDDSRRLHVTVHGPKASVGPCRPAFSSPATPSSASRVLGRGDKSSPLLSATFTFDDHIRCMAAKQRLTKGRAKARQRKMHQVAQLLELPGDVGPRCPSPPALNLHSLRKEAAAHRKNAGLGRNGSDGGASINASALPKPQHFGGLTLINQQQQQHKGGTTSKGAAYRSEFPAIGKLAGSTEPSGKLSTGAPRSDVKDDEAESHNCPVSIRQQAVSKLASSIGHKGLDHADAQQLDKTAGSSPGIGRSTLSSSFGKKRASASNESAESQGIALIDYGSSPQFNSMFRDRMEDP